MVVEFTCKGAVPVATVDPIRLLKVFVPPTVWSVERSTKFFTAEPVPPRDMGRMP
jgi:hypothetical protein